MDIFIEQIVKRKRTLRDKLIFVLVIVLTVFVPATVFMLALNNLILHYFVILGLFAFFMGIWLVWFVRSHQNSEYEYQMVQDTLVVSKIIAKRKRKELLKLDVHNIDRLETFDKMGDVKVVKVIEAAADMNDEKNIYCAIFSIAGGGKRALFFNPNEKVMNAMKPYLKKEIVLELFYHRGVNR